MDLLLLLVVIGITAASLAWPRQQPNLPHIAVTSQLAVAQPTPVSIRDPGAEGEALVAYTLEQILGALCEHDGEFGIANSIVLNIAPGTKYPTAEVDHLVFTPWGIFVIETKHWSGHIGPATPETLVQSFPDGSWDMRTNPLVQNRSKVAFLKRILPEHQHAIRSVGVFANRDMAIDPCLPSDLIRLDDLPYWIRLQRERYLKRCDPMDAVAAWHTILQYADITPEGLLAHKARVSAA